MSSVYQRQSQPFPELGKFKAVLTPRLKTDAQLRSTVYKILKESDVI